MVEWEKNVNCVGPLKWIVASFLIHTRTVSCHWPGDTKKKLPLENTKHFDVFSRATLEPRNEDAFACVYIHRIAMAYKCQISSYYVYIYTVDVYTNILYDRTHP